MSSIIDRFFISVGLKTEDVERGMQELDNTLTNGFKEIAAGIIAPLAGMISAGALFANYVDEATKVKKLADSFKMSTDAVQEWRGAYEAAGVEADEFTSTYHDMNDYITDSIHNQSGPLQEMVDNYGLALKDMNGKTKDAETVMFEMSDIFEKIGSQESIGLAKRLGITDDVIPLFQKGSNGIREIMARQKELGFYTKEDTERAQAFTKALQEVTRAFKMSLVPVLSAVTPFIVKLGEVFTKAFILMRQHSTVIKTAIAGLALVLVATLVPSINAVKAASLAMIRSPIGQFIALFILLGMVIEDSLVYIEGGESALPGLWSKFGTGEEIAAKLNGAFEQTKEIVSGIVSFFEQWGGKIAFVATAAMALMAVVKIVLAVWAAVVKVWGVLQIVGNLVQGIIILFSMLAGVGVGMAAGIVVALAGVVAALYWVYENWEMVKEAARSFGDVCGRIIDDVISAFSRFVSSVTDLMSRFFNWLGDSFSEKIGALKNGLLEIIGMEGEASRLAISGKGGGNQTWSADYSTKNYFGNESSPANTGFQFKGLIGPGMGGING